MISVENTWTVAVSYTHLSRSGDIIWNLFKLGTWSGVLDIEDFESDVKNFLDSGQQISKRSR